MASLFLCLGAHQAAAQGTLTNGWTHTGAISPAGDSDVWTFPANAGDRIVIRVGEITQTGNFSARIRLNNPSAVQQAAASGVVAAEISVNATNSGTFTLTVDDVVGTTATGTYRVTLAKTPGSISVAPGDEGGTMINSVMHAGTIETGDLDVWTFTANSGDALTVGIGETTSGSSLTPAVWLYGPDGRLLDSGSGVAAAQASFRATNSGTFTVVAGDFSSGFAGSGGYRLTLAKTGEAITVSPDDNGGPLTNGVMHLGTIEVGDLDVWNFTASAGESITLRMGETASGSPLTPALWLYGPNGALLDSEATSVVATEVSFRATNSGTFTVVAGDFSSGFAGSGGYRLTLAKTGSPIVVSPGDEGGALVNGAVHAGVIDVGDLDVWSFTAAVGDSITASIGETISGSAVTPALWLYGPDGRLLDSGNGTFATQVGFRATNSGTFMLVVGDFTSGYAGAGAYRLTLAKTGSPFVVSPGDEGGALTNGVMHTGTVELGEVDMWSFTATTGNNIDVRIGEVTNGVSLTPALWLYGPDGRLLDSGSGVAATSLSFRATNSGTFIVVAGDFSNGFAGSGAYRLTLALTGGPITVSPDDEGGPLANGLMHTGTIQVGDMDVWSFTATQGDSFSVGIGETLNGSALTPALWLYGPDGRLLDSEFGVAAAQAGFRATNSGTFTVVVGDLSNGFAGSGSYRLTLAKAPGEVFVAPGDEGGPLNGAATHDGNLEVGDLEVFYFTACLGDTIAVRMDELVTGSALTPFLRLYGRDGVLIRSTSGAATAQFSAQATNFGTFILVAGDFSNGFAGSGTYRLTLNGLSAGLKLCVPDIAGATVSLTGIGGPAGNTFVVHTHTNVTAPMAVWLPIRTNQFDRFGVSSVTNAFDPNELQRYFRLEIP